MATLTTRLLGRRRVRPAEAVTEAAPLQERRRSGRVIPLDRSIRERRPTSVLVIQIEYFGKLSLQKRRAMTDELHRRIEWELPQHLRASDVTYREARDRVCVLLPGTGAEQAMVVAERMQRMLELGTLPTQATVEISVLTSVSNTGETA